MILKPFYKSLLAQKIEKGFTTPPKGAIMKASNKVQHPRFQAMTRVGSCLITIEAYSFGTLTSICTLLISGGNDNEKTVLFYPNDAYNNYNTCIVQART